ncbi:hypothetical protein NLM27_24355 [Bradyrhizobium sp. CCGB12]|uniref:hypothetical protein n=1 Tax=Bradyrhizobium sp. CCGB12 TaxID=2949632 RepID=UPI0020B34CAB|nr:hypothetical protein [Bradyrhizobium sp. CCGB12]MCP3391929.1 hypothetical protein [Bradyrhizobium sp. CCGB12]
MIHTALGRRFIIAVMSLTSLAPWAAFAEPGDSDAQEAFATMLGRITKCSMILPTATQTIKSANRIGAVSELSLVYSATVNSNFPKEIVTKNDNKPWCTPKAAFKLPDAADYQQHGNVPFRQKKLDIGGSAKVELEKIFKLVDASWSYVDAVAFGISDIQSVDLDTGDQKASIGAMLDRGAECSDSLKSTQSQMIWRICTGQVKLGVYFNREVRGSIVNANLGALQANFEAHYQSELSGVAETPCKGDSPVAAGAGAPGARSTGSSPAVAPSPARAATPVANSPSAATSPSTNQAIAAAAGAAAAAAVVAVLGGSGTQPGAAAAAAAAAPAESKPKNDTADPDKCYKYAIYESAPNAVVGVNLTPKGSGSLSVVGLTKAVKSERQARAR